MTETIEQKGHRILREGRLTVLLVRPDGLIRARCRGFTDGEVYELGYRPDESRWGCTCEASAKFHRRCSHLIALQLVTVKPQ